MSSTEISTPNGSIPAYLAVPLPDVSGPGPWPGVVVIHDAFGLKDDIRAYTDRFATAGYLAIAPDLYSRGNVIRCIQSAMLDMRRARGRAFDDIDAARVTLADRADCTGKIGVAGFCMGGGFALIGASRGFDASAPYYGQLPSDVSVLDDACPVVASFGGRDPMLRGAAAKLETALTERTIPHDVKEYPNATHGFANRKSLGPVHVLTKVMGIRYDHESAEDAWQRVLTFFAEHLS
jgi:carboxymethylenebutenolidase